jgi:hypothetical protein
MAFMVIGVGLVKKPGAGTLVGVLTGLMAMIMLAGRQGIFEAGMKYLIPGLVVDAMMPFFGYRLDKPVFAMAVAAVAHVSKLMTATVIGIIAGVPGGFLALGLGLATTTHILFGALGGLLGSTVLKRLQKAGINLDEPGDAEPAQAPDTGVL